MLEDLLSKLDALRQAAGDKRQEARKLMREASYADAEWHRILEEFIDERPEELRDVRGPVTQAAVAGKARVNQSYVSMLESGRLGQLSMKAITNLLRVYVELEKLDDARRTSTFRYQSSQEHV